MNALTALLAYCYNGVTNLLCLMILGSAIGGILLLFFALLVLRVTQRHNRKIRLADYKPVKLNIFLDFETFFTREYSLRRMTTIEYVRDPRFEILGCAIALGDHPVVWHEPEEFKVWAENYVVAGYDDDTIICHNTLFDGLVLREHYGIDPWRWGDTLAMARATLPIQKRDLGSVGETLGFGGKVREYLTPNVHKADDRLIAGALRDVELCRRIYNTLLPCFSDSELRLIDLTTRCGIESHIHLNVDLLEQSLQEAVQEREQTIAASGYTEKELTSNPKFAKILESLNVELPTKISASTGEETEAFSKNDPEFQALITEYPEHRDLFLGRMAAKSNITISRTEKLLRIARQKPTMPMPLNYWGARTTGRWSGADGLNVQNLPKKGHIRESFHAPKGWKLIAPDSNKIELRVNLWFSGQFDMLLAADTGDIYRKEAAGQFHIPEDAVTYTQRQFGKVVQLGCGFGMGWKKFRGGCAAGPLGMDPIYLSEEEAQGTIYGYRGRHQQVKESWYFNQDRLQEMLFDDCNIHRGPIAYVKNGIILPGDMMISYPNLHMTKNGDWVYGMHADDAKNIHIYGGKIQENIVQALARKIIADQMLEIAACGIQVISMTHDEIICLVRETEADQALAQCIDIMSRPPQWAPDLPLGAEGHITDHYGKA